MSLTPIREQESRKFILFLDPRLRGDDAWMPAFAGMTKEHLDPSII
jgi:hypothetical protein